MNKKKINLWIINQYGVTPEYPASTRHYELAKYLSKTMNVSVWGSNFIHHNKKYRYSKWTIFKKETVDNFTFCWIGAMSYEGNGIFRVINMVMFAILLLLVGIFRREKPDVIIGSSPTLFTAFSCLLISKVKRSNFVLEVRDLWPDSLIEMSNKQNRFIVFCLRWIERTLYNKAKLIIVLTKGIEKKLHEYGVCPKKIFFLPNGIDINSLPSQTKAFNIREKIRTKAGFSEEDFVFMYSGAHGLANDLNQIILSAVKLKDCVNIKIVLMGSGSEKEKLEKEVLKLNLKNIVFLPAVPKEKVYDYLNCADAFILCLKDISLFKGALPNKLFDYLLYDRPVITTIRGEVEDFLTRYEIGHYGNINETGEYYLPTVMRKLAINSLDKKNANMINNRGLEIIQKYYSREKQADELRIIINRLI